MGGIPKIDIFVGNNTSPLTALRVQKMMLEFQINAIPSATLRLAPPGNQRTALLDSADLSVCQPGEAVTIKVNGKEAFKGVIVEKRIQVTHDSCLELTLRHPLIALDVFSRSQIFRKQRDADVLQALCAPVMRVGVTAQMENLLEQRVQYQCSDWQMVRYLLDQNGAWLLPRLSEVVVVKPAVAVQADHTLSAKTSKSDGNMLLRKVDCLFTALNQPEQLDMTAWDIQKQQSLKVTAKPGNLGQGALGSALHKPLSKQVWQINYSTSPDEVALSRYASSLLMNLNLEHVQGKFTVAGSMDYQPGQTMEVIDGGAGLNGKGLITAVRHTFTHKSEWSTEIRLGRSGAVSPVVMRKVPEGVHPGVVQAFEVDEQNLDRFRVSLPVLGEQDNVLWARFSVPYASKNSGFICYPEPGDEVLVQFLGGQPDYPVIMNSMYNLKNPAPIPADKDNAVKGLIISPDENSRMQWLFDKKEQSILQDTGKEQVILHEGITLKADDKNQLVLNKKVELTGESVTVKVSDDNHLILNGSAELKGTNVSVQGSQIDLKNG